ncbi:unnamed protein product [Schistocephalus solidus]|uniref:Pyocin n=1 Tax=Schistocephalus solidus TaxID=70667 RepID=A0A183ST74_SCHSO|nr:unnamed protein product [Schistocephalus solidus]
MVYCRETFGALVMLIEPYLTKALVSLPQYLTAGPDGRVLLWESRGISSTEPRLRPQSKEALQANQSPFDQADRAAAKKANNPVAALLAAARAYNAALKMSTGQAAQSIPGLPL